MLAFIINLCRFLWEIWLNQNGNGKIWILWKLGIVRNWVFLLLTVSFGYAQFLLLKKELHISNHSRQFAKTNHFLLSPSLSKFFCNKKITFYSHSFVSFSINVRHLSQGLKFIKKTVLHLFLHSLFLYIVCLKNCRFTLSTNVRGVNDNRKK